MIELTQASRKSPRNTIETPLNPFKTRPKFSKVDGKFSPIACTLTSVKGLQSYLDQLRLCERQSRRLLVLRPGHPHVVETPR